VGVAAVAVSVEVPPEHTAVGEALTVNARGFVAFTVTTVVAGVPQPVLYEMVAFPPATPVTIPVLLPTVATAVEELLQVPPPVALVKDVVELTHTMPVPLIAAGEELTVTVAKEFPQALMYDMFTVPPETPDAIPVPDPTVAIDVLELLHVPPVDALVKVVLPVKQSDNVPPIDAGLLFTVTTDVAKLPHPVE